LPIIFLFHFLWPGSGPPGARGPRFIEPPQPPVATPLSVTVPHCWCCRSLHRSSCTFPVDTACNFHGRFIALSPLHRRVAAAWFHGTVP